MVKVTPSFLMRSQPRAPPGVEKIKLPTIPAGGETVKILIDVVGEPLTL